jgi:hypothetical protein
MGIVGQILMYWKVELCNTVGVHPFCKSGSVCIRIASLKTLLFCLTL